MGRDREIERLCLIAEEARIQRSGRVVLMIGGAIAINFDERGRLWAVESFDYPHDTLSNAFA